MPVTTITTAGTRVQVSTTVQFGARLTLQWVGVTATSKVFVGVPGKLNSAALVSATVYDCFLNAANPSVTIGIGETLKSGLVIHAFWLDSDTNGEKVAWFVEDI